MGSVKPREVWCRASVPMPRQFYACWRCPWLLLVACEACEEYRRQSEKVASSHPPAIITFTSTHLGPSCGQCQCYKVIKKLLKLPQCHRTLTDKCLSIPFISRCDLVIKLNHCDYHENIFSLYF